MTIDCQSLIKHSKSVLVYANSVPLKNRGDIARNARLTEFIECRSVINIFLNIWDIDAIFKGMLFAYASTDFECPITDWPTIAKI